VRPLKREDQAGTMVYVVTDAGAVIRTMTDGEVFRVNISDEWLVYLEGSGSECSIERCFVEDSFDSVQSLSIFIEEWTRAADKIRDTHPHVFSRKLSDLDRKVRFARALRLAIETKAYIFDPAIGYYNGENDGEPTEVKPKSSITEMSK